MKLLYSALNGFSASIWWTIVYHDSKYNNTTKETHTLHIISAVCFTLAAICWCLQ